MALVLVVDDEPDVRLLANVVLTREGHVVEEAVDGPAGLARLARDPRPEAVVLDVRMPGIDGLAVLDTIGPDGPPVVLVTADPRALETGVRWALSKPYRPEELVAAVAAAIAESGASTEP